MKSFIGGLSRLRQKASVSARVTPTIRISRQPPHHRRLTRKGNGSGAPRATRLYEPRSWTVLHAVELFELTITPCDVLLKSWVKV